MKFTSKKDLLFVITIFGINGFIIGIMISEVAKGDIDTNLGWYIFINSTIVGFLFWLYFGTNYELSKENGLIYRCGPFKGKIGIDRITEVIKGKTLWIGFKPATSRRGLIIKFDKYNEIYISPKTNDLFIDKLLELKGDIKITEP